MAKETKKLDELFHDTLKDIYFAEKKILATLPKMAKAAQSEELRGAFEKHEAETEDQIGRLEEVFAAIERSPREKLRRHRRHHRRRRGNHAGIQGIASARCRFAGRGSGRRALRNLPLWDLIAWAEQLGLEDVVSLLEETLEEERATDEALTEIAKTAINQQAEAA